MTGEFDVAVTGLGAMGSAAAYQLSARGQRVVGLDRYKPPHEFGSSHGRSRIIREAYFEDPLYVPLVKRAYALWQQLEQESGRQLLLPIGGVMIGPRDGVLVAGAERSAHKHRLEHRFLSAHELREKFPAFVPAANTAALWEPRAGVLLPELAVQTQLELATQHGATLRFNEPVLRWEPRGTGVRVTTATGAYDARRLLLAAGAWTSSLLLELHLPLVVERQVLYWFEPRANPDWFAPERCPVFLCEYAPGRFFYGFPDLGDGMKIALHHEGETTTTDTVRRTVDALEIEAMRTLLRAFLPAADGAPRSTAVCVYTNTPDEHFLLDFHPGCEQVLIASPCSGHGFKFAPVIGEIAAALLEERAVPFDLGLFGLERFKNRL